LQRLGTVGDVDVDGSIDSGRNNAVIEWEGLGERIPTSEHLARKRLTSLDSGIDSGRGECELGTDGDSTLVGNGQSGVGRETNVTARNESASKGQNLGRAKGHVERLGDSTSSIEDIEDALVAGLDGKDGGSGGQYVLVHDESGRTSVCTNADVLDHTGDSGDGGYIAKDAAEIELASFQRRSSDGFEGLEQEVDVSLLVLDNSLELFDGDLGR